MITILDYTAALLLLAFTWYLDTRNYSVRIKSLINLILVSSVLSFLVALASTMGYFGNTQLASLLSKLLFVFIALFSSNLFILPFRFPVHMKRKLPVVFSWLFFIGGVYIVFFKFDAVVWNNASGILVTSAPSTVGSLTWFQLFMAVFAVCLPALTFAVMILRSIFTKNRLHRQMHFLSALSLLLGTVLLYLLWKAYGIEPLYLKLFPYALFLYLSLQFRVGTLSPAYDIASAFSELINSDSGGRIQSETSVFSFHVLVSFFLQYVLVSAVVGVVFAVFNAFFPGFPFWSVLLCFCISVAMLYLRTGLESFLKKRIHSGTDYGQSLKYSLESLDFTENSEVLTEKVADILQKNIEMSGISILIDTGEDKLKTAFSTNNLTAEFDAANPALVMLLNHGVSIVFKTDALIKEDFSPVRDDLLGIFEQCRAEAMIVLREGYHIFGLFMFGQKKYGEHYTDYDYGVFSDLYSQFFVIAYYIKNIANQSIVGTVDREIEFSGQIIHSIQENVDRINNPKTDTGYISLSARRLGGDFVDFIRLTSERYIFVMGDVSGKGLNASMSMVILKSVIRTFLNETRDFKELVVKVNGFIKYNLPRGTFFAGVFALADFSENMLYYINCGVPGMFLYTEAYKTAIEIQGDGKVLGFVKDIFRYIKVKKIKFSPSDILLTCTDGLIDSRSLRGERFGKDRIQRFIADNRQYPAGKMAEFLYENLMEFTSKQLEDDISVVVMKYLG